MSLLIFAVLFLAQDSSPERLVTASGEEIRGAISRIEPDGSLVVAGDKGSRTIPLEEVRRIQFEDKPQITIRKSVVRLRPRCGGSLGGSVVGIDADSVTFKGEFGTCVFRRSEVRSIVFGEVPAVEKELAEDRDHVLLAPEDEKSKEAEVVSGELARMDAEILRVGETDVPRSRVREIRFRGGPAKDPALGLFARVQLKSGDGLVGVLRAAEAGRIQLFTHYAGVAAIDKTAIHSITMVPQARMQTGHFLLTTHQGVTEVDRQGVKLWTCTEEVAGCSSARKLPNGNVLVTVAQQNKVLEMRPVGASGGKVVWSQEGLSYPYDALRLENGNTLIAEYGAARIAEFEPREFTLKWSASVSQAMTVERLEGGVYLVSPNQGPAVEVEANGRIRQRHALTGVKMCRATPTADGTILVSDSQGVQVIEVDRKSNVLRRIESAQPRIAYRLDDGNTIILRMNGELVEVDSTGHPRRIGLYPGAAFFSVY